MKIAPIKSHLDLILLVPKMHPQRHISAATAANRTQNKNSKMQKQHMYMLIGGAAVLLLCGGVLGVGYWKFDWFKKKAGGNKKDVKKGQQLGGDKGGMDGDDA